jgi:hypothetical protein
MNGGMPGIFHQPRDSRPIRAATALAIFEPAVLTDRQAEHARTATHAKSQRVPVPLPALRLFVQLLSELAGGKPVTLVPLRDELPTQEAADLLNVSNFR